MVSRIAMAWGHDTADERRRRRARPQVVDESSERNH
jgi:hypothetical protein